MEQVKRVPENTLVTGLRLVTHWTRGSASQEPAEPARQCVPRQEPWERGLRACSPRDPIASTRGSCPVASI